MTGSSKFAAIIAPARLSPAARSWNFPGFSLGAGAGLTAMIKEIAFEDPYRYPVAICLDAVSAKAFASDLGPVTAQPRGGDCPPLR